MTHPGLAPFRRSRFRFRAVLAPALAGLGLGVAALVLAQWLAAVGRQCAWLPSLEWRRSLPWLPWLFLAVCAFALTHRAGRQPAASGQAGLAWRAWVFGFALTAAGVFSLDASAPGVALAYYGALWLLGGGLLSRWFTHSHAELSAVRSLRSWLALPLAAPHAVFVLAALGLLTVVGTLLTLGRAASAERLANWAFGFLAAGVLVALLNAVVRQPRAWRWLSPARHVPAPVWLAAGLMGTAYGLAVLDNAPFRYDAGYQSAVAYLQPRLSRTAVVLTQGIPLGLRCFGLPLGREVAFKPAGDLSQLPPTLGDSEQVFFVYAPLGNGQIAPTQFALELRADLVARHPESIGVDVYQAAPPEALRAALDSPADFGPLQVAAAAYSPEVRAGGALAVHLSLIVADQLGRDYVAQLVLLDEQGQTWADPEILLLNHDNAATARWSVGEQTEAYLLLPVPPGTPPRAYTLALGFWDAAANAALDLRDRAGLQANRLLPLGTVQVVRQVNLAADPYDTLPELNLSVPEPPPDVQLVGFSPPAGIALPGDWLRFRLQWEGRPGLNFETVLYRLVNGAVVLAESEAVAGGADFPPQLWLPGEQVLDWGSLQVPSDAPPGAAQLQLAAGASAWVNLGTVTVQPITRTFEAPSPDYPVGAHFGSVAELVGYHLTAPDSSTVEVMLYWRAINGVPLSASYKVFVHALAADGRLLAQSDAAPAGWTRPTTSWLRGEYVADAHRLAVPAAGEPVAALRVGLYEPDTLARLPVEGGDFLVLPAPPIPASP